MGKHTLHRGGVVGPETRNLIGRRASVANRVGRLMSKIDAQWESGVGTRLIVVLLLVTSSCFFARCPRGRPQMYVGKRGTVIGQCLVDVGDAAEFCERKQNEGNGGRREKSES